MARFPSIPSIVLSGGTERELLLFEPIKTSIDLLTGNSSNPTRAVLTEDILVRTLGEQDMRNVRSIGEGFTIQDVNLAGLEDYVQLIEDVQALANDLAYTRRVINELIKQLKG